MAWNKNNPSNDELLINFPAQCRANWEALELLTNVNLQITNAKVAAGANIADTKLAQITTASKVSGTALTGLASIPAGAGVLPDVNSPHKLKADVSDTTPQYLDGLIDTSMFQISAGDLLQLKDGIGTEFRAGDLMLSSLTSSPSGWSDVSASYNNKFIRISSATPLDTGGNDAHTHGAGSYSAGNHTHSLPANTGSTTYNTCSDEGGACSHEAMTTHSHTIGGSTGSAGGGAISGTSGVASDVPAYVQLRIFQKN